MRGREGRRRAAGCADAQRGRLAASTGVFALPELLFGANALSIAHAASGFRMRFCAEDALAFCSRRKAGAGAAAAAAAAALPVADMPADGEVEVSAAGKWKGLAAGNPKMEKLDLGYDWTFSTPYAGSAEGAAFAPSEVAVNVELLKRQEPILWYDDVRLFEDELHDNGVSQLSVKVRVMPSCFFALLRLWLRVDGVLLRAKETRVFHEFGQPRVTRQITWRALTFDQLRREGKPTESAEYRDADKVIASMPIVYSALHAAALARD